MQEAEVEGTRSQSPICLPVAMGKPLATHTEASTKLITAHQAHRCDDHPRSQSRDFFSLTKHRDARTELYRTEDDSERQRQQFVAPPGVRGPRDRGGHARGSEKSREQTHADHVTATATC